MVMAELAMLQGGVVRTFLYDCKHDYGWEGQALSAGLSTRKDLPGLVSSIGLGWPAQDGHPYTWAARHSR